MKMLFKRMLLFGLAALCFLSVTAQKKQVTGTVRDADGNGVPSVTVKEKGTNNQTLTNASGTFKISVASNATLVFSSVGYESQEVSVDGKNTVEVSLSSSSKEIGEVVVTALGITKQQRSLGYAATTIKADELVKSGTTNFATALYGKAPGVKIAATPGGATSGVAIQVRGVNSINFKSTPLVIMDGVPVRDGGFDNSNYWGDQRIRANGLVDFNPEDIESISILKGASAAALYGSEAVNGVILITTKSGKGKKGFSLDFNASYTRDEIAYLPKWQKQRGAGLPIGYSVMQFGSQYANNNFDTRTVNGTTYRVLPGASINFGPDFDGQPILCWDGQIRPYSYQENGFANLFQKANNSTVNLAMSNTTDRSSSRFSYTFQHTEGLSLNSRNDKHNFNFNNHYKLGKKVNTDIIINYMNWHVHNRPYMIDRMINNFTGMFPAFDNGDWYKAKYKTSLGYKYVRNADRSLTPAENIIYPNFRTDIGDFLWNVLENNTDEYINRINAVTKVNYEIVKNLNLQGRISTDYTTTRSFTRNHSSIPLAYGYSGYYGVNTNTYALVYGDVLLSYKKELNKDITLTAMAGYNARTEQNLSTSVGTTNGLTTENKFDLSSSKDAYGSSSMQTYFITDAVFGTINFDYKNYLFAEATVRRDRTSTMNPNNNSFVYPSVNTGFVFSDAFTLPKWVNYGKLRASWGIVGNYPGLYLANPAYSVGNLTDQGNGSVLTNAIKNSPYGNAQIKPETKNEWEIGLESKLLGNRLSVDITYYYARINDQILSLNIPQSSGANSILTNIGSLENKGWEFNVHGTPVETKSFSWETGINFAVNKNKVLKLTTGSNELLHANYDGDALKRVSIVGEAMGDWYAHPVKTNSKGEMIVGADGTYVLDADKWQKYGNSMPKGSGGYWNRFEYKSFSLDINTDFTFGGYVAPTGLYWLTSRGLTEESVKVPADASRSGIKYWVDNNWVGHETTGTAGPGGQKVMTDGMLLKGVKADGTPNDIVISPAIYYWYAYNWGGPQYSNSLYYKYVNKNNYLKLRELTLTYNLPAKLAGKMKANKLQLSVYGRNLFYFYRTIKNMDAEQLTTGSYWGSNVSNAGTNPSSRSYGIMIRANF